MGARPRLRLRGRRRRARASTTPRLLQPRRLYERQGRCDEYARSWQRFKRERAEYLRGLSGAGRRDRRRRLLSNAQVEGYGQRTRHPDAGAVAYASECAILAGRQGRAGRVRTIVGALLGTRRHADPGRRHRPRTRRGHAPRASTPPASRSTGTSRRPASTSWRRLGTPLPDSVIESFRRTKVALKAPITTPVGTGFRSVNVYLRQALDLYACVRPCKTLPGRAHVLHEARSTWSSSARTPKTSTPASSSSRASPRPPS